MNDPLAELKDIHIPSSVDIWPPAYGWWLVALIALLCLIGLSRFLMKKRKCSLAKRQALAELKTINADLSNWPLTLNTLLKRVAQSYFPALPIQSLYGEQWTQFLSLALPEKQRADFNASMLLFQQNLYQSPTMTISELESAKSLVYLWLTNAKLSHPKVYQSLYQWTQKTMPLNMGENHV